MKVMWQAGGQRAWGFRGRAFFARAGGAFFLLAGAGCGSLREAAPAAGRDAQLLEYRGEAAQLRGLPLTREVAVERETREALLRTLEAELDKPENCRFLAETERLLRQFRVLNAGVPLRDLYVRLMGEQVAAYYDPEKKRVAYVDAPAAGQKGETPVSGPLVERFVYVHEFCHAVEDAHFDLDRLGKAALSDLDRNLALTAFIEGNAVLVGADSLCGAFPGNTATPLGAFLVSALGRLELAQETAGALKECPAFLGGALLRPYLDGAVFCNRLRRDAGWQALNAAYRSHLPSSTAEILYPERRYLRPFTPAVFSPEAGLFAGARQGGLTNSLGVLGTALWLGGEKVVSARQFGFLKGWMGDRVDLFEGTDGVTRTVWLSYWERPGMARAFRRQAERRLGGVAFKGVPSCVRREGRLVAAVWATGTNADVSVCERLASCALRTRVTAETPSLPASWWFDAPWPVEVSANGAGLLGGYGAEFRAGPGYFRFDLASGVLLRAETNPDRHYYGTLGGLLRHVEDARSDFTFWKVPLVASWHRQGEGDARRFRWTMLGGFLADGDRQRARVLFVPVWRAER